VSAADPLLVARRHVDLLRVRSAACRHGRWHCPDRGRVPRPVPCSPGGLPPACLNRGSA